MAVVVVEIKIYVFRFSKVNMIIKSLNESLRCMFYLFPLRDGDRCCLRITFSWSMTTTNYPQQHHDALSTQCWNCCFLKNVFCVLVFVIYCHPGFNIYGPKLKILILVGLLSPTVPAPELIAHLSSPQFHNKWSKHFYERPRRRRADFSRGQYNVTPTSRQRCSLLQQ